MYGLTFFVVITSIVQTYHDLFMHSLVPEKSTVFTITNNAAMDSYFYIFMHLFKYFYKIEFWIKKLICNILKDTNNIALQKSAS